MATTHKFPSLEDVCIGRGKVTVVAGMPQPVVDLFVALHLHGGRGGERTLVAFDDEALVVVVGEVALVIFPLVQHQAHLILCHKGAQLTKEHGLIRGMKFSFVLFELHIGGGHKVAGITRRAGQVVLHFPVLVEILP